jgi:hypothetical protein
MSWLKKVFGSGTSSSGGDGGVVDLRSNAERRMGRDAAKGLGASDESAARGLCRLASESQKMGDSKYNEMTRIGEQLYGRGGHALMQQVCYRVKALGGSYTYVSTAWNGVGEWRD